VDGPLVWAGGVGVTIHFPDGKQFSSGEFL
jgi:hypothetical protein